MSRALHRISTALALAVLVVALADVPANASPTISGPVITLDATDVQPGQRVIATIDGFDAPIVTITVCGNRALHGSPDCNMTAGKGVKLDTDGTATDVQFAVQAPPVPCPCVVRAASRGNDEVAITPITLIGHPSAPVDESVPEADIADALAVSVAAAEATDGIVPTLRFGLGGPGTYAVTMKVTNRSKVALSGISVFGSVGRSSSDDLAVLDLAKPGVLEAGQTWEQTLKVKVPGPLLGTLHWRVTAARDGKSLMATTATRHRPVLLIAVAMFLVLDLALVAMRVLVRRRAAHERQGADRLPAEDVAPAI